jgi:splicing suppressor protein 51
MADTNTTTSTANAAPAQCACCAKTASEDVSLKRCAKCQTTLYCSRDCQKADWKQHKKVCTQNAAARDSTTASASDRPNAGSHRGANTRTPSASLIAPIDKPFHALNDKKWLHNRPEADVYKLLIDAYRLRMEDDYKVSGDADRDSIYGGAPNGYAGFRRFVDKIEARNRELLPSWWSDEKARECEGVGRRGGWSSLNGAIEKSDVVDHYGDPMFPMQLRMFAEQIYGSGPGGQSGSAMLQLQMMAESGGGGMHTSHIDVSQFM